MQPACPHCATMGKLDTVTDWSGIRAAASQIGIRAAARRASSHLPEDEQERFVQRVMKRASREDWHDKTQAVLTVVREDNSLSAPVRNGADILNATLLEDGNVTRLHSMRYARNVTKHAADMSEQTPDEALTRASDVKAALDVAARAGNWMDKDGQSGTPLALFQVNGDMTINQS